MVNEDPFPPVASVNIAAMDLRAVLNEKMDEKFSPNARIRKVWILKQYLVHMDELAVQGKCLQLEKRKRIEGINTILNRKSRKINPSKKRMFLQKRDILFQKERAGILQGGEYLQGLSSLILFHLNNSSIWCSIRNFPKSSLELKR